MSDKGVDLRDQLSIDTPELVGIELPLAGLGSRCIALIVDSVVQGFSMLALLVVGIILIALLPGGSSVRHSNSSGDPAKWALALLILIPFLLQWGYFSLFESMGRNLIRIIDMLPGFYLIGALCIFANRRQQRLGDMVAGTLVVHSVPVETPMLPQGTRTFTAAAIDRPPQPMAPRTVELPADAVARLSRDDLQLMENFLARRLDLPLAVRANLAEKLSRRMKEKIRSDIPSGTSNETFLEALVFGLREVGHSNSS